LLPFFNAGNFMNPNRRTLLQLIAVAAAVAGAPRLASALDYPTRPVRIIVGFPAGSTSDVLARLVAQRLSERLGQPFVVEDRSGASGNIATEAVVHAPADGYTLLLAGSNHAINDTLFKNLGFSFNRDIAPIAGIMQTPGVMEVNPSVPAKTVPEFIAYAKANPGKINMGSGGTGSLIHMYGVLFMLMTGVKMVDVPYPGTPPALADLIAGRLQVMFDNVPTSLGFVRDGRLRPLAVIASKHIDVLPDIPPLGDYLPGYEGRLWQGIAAPKNTPSEIIEKINTEINTALANPQFNARIVALGGTPLSLSPAAFGRLIAEDTAKWGKVIRDANIKLE
jgi:tripartite-type tricarboxylate transporter receptor subunit TctC